MSSKPRGIDSSTEDGFASHLSGQSPSVPNDHLGGQDSYPKQTPSNALKGQTVGGHLKEGDAPSNPRSGSRGNVDRSVTSDALIKTQ